MDLDWASRDPLAGIYALHINPNTAQVGYRGRSTDSGTLNNNTNWAAAVNTPWTQDVDTTFRVRLAVEENAGATIDQAGQLEANLNGGAFQNVTTTSTIVKAVNSALFNDGDSTADLAIGGAGTFANGTGSTDGLAAAVTLLSQHTEWEFAVQIVGADVADNDTIVLRVGGLNAYTVAGASITVNEAAPPTNAPAGLAAGTGDALGATVQTEEPGPPRYRTFLAPSQAVIRAAVW